MHQRRRIRTKWSFKWKLCIFGIRFPSMFWINKPFLLASHCYRERDFCFGAVFCYIISLSITSRPWFGIFLIVPEFFYPPMSFPLPLSLLGEKLMTSTPAPLSFLGEELTKTPLLTEWAAPVPEVAPPAYSYDIVVKIHILWLCFDLHFRSEISCFLLYSRHLLPIFVFMVIDLFLPCLFHFGVFVAFITSCPGPPWFGFFGSTSTKYRMIFVAAIFLAFFINKKNGNYSNLGWNNAVNPVIGIFQNLLPC